jgi:hypothetical protein
MPSRQTLLRICATGLGFGLADCLGIGGKSPNMTTAGTTTADPTATRTTTASEP